MLQKNILWSPTWKNVISTSCLESYTHFDEANPVVGEDSLTLQNCVLLTKEES